MAEYDLILTHPGGAHTDEFLACALLIAVHGVPIVRREPTVDELDTPAVCVVDVGLRHEPARNNFDHHQFPKDYPPTCALSLVLQHLGRLEGARRSCDWLETVERFDTRGPIETAKWLGITNEAMNRLSSPVATTLLRRFARVSQLNPGDPIWEVMRMVGADLIEYVDSLCDRLAYLEKHAEFWNLDLGGQPAQVVFLPRTDPPLDDPSFAIDRFVQGHESGSSVVATVSPDRRGTGYGLERYRDNPRVDFTRIDSHPGVHFAHARGFVAKTSITDVDQLKALLVAASAPPTA